MAIMRKMGLNQEQNSETQSESRNVETNYREQKDAANQRAEELQPIRNRRVTGEQNSLNQSDNKRNVIGNEEPQPIRGEDNDSQLENKNICLLIRFKVDWQVLSDYML